MVALEFLHHLELAHRFWTIVHPCGGSLVGSLGLLPIEGAVHFLVNNLGLLLESFLLAHSLLVKTLVDIASPPVTTFWPSLALNDLLWVLINYWVVASFLEHFELALYVVALPLLVHGWVVRLQVRVQVCLATTTSFCQEALVVEDLGRFIVVNKASISWFRIGLVEGILIYISWLETRVLLLMGLHCGGEVFLELLILDFLVIIVSFVDQILV